MNDFIEYEIFPSFKIHHLLALYFLSATFSIGASETILFLIAIFWGYGLLKKPEIFKIKRSNLDILILFYLLISLISIIFSTNFKISLTHIKHFALLLIFIFGVAALRDGNRTRFYLKLFILGGAINCFYALSKHFILGEGGLSKRLHGFIGSWMTFSGFMMIILLLLIAKIITLKNFKNRFIYAILSFFFFIAILLSMTRNSWIGLIFGIFTLTFLNSKKLFFISIALIIIGSLIVIPYLPKDLKDRIKSIVDIENQTNKERIYMAKIAWNIIKKHPFWGIGPGNLQLQLKNYAPAGVDPNWNIPHLHNNLFQVAVDKGIIGLSVWIAIFIKWLYDALIIFYRNKFKFPDLQIGAISVVIAFLISGLFEYNFGDSEILMIILFIMAIPYALSE